MTRILLEQNRKTGEMEIKGNALLDKHGLHDWRISFENLRNAMYAPNDGDRGFWGYCDFENKVIRIDWRVGRRFRQTMLHEIAHALVGKLGHGEEWIKKAAEIGCTPNELWRYEMEEEDRKKEAVELFVGDQSQ
jgi:hypothetical protein